ncbi:MAG: hypothetical protein K0R18_1622 [Bacillales bacterium]|nr:hypothetical protein [Bacillales bacterium]
MKIIQKYLVVAMLFTMLIAMSACRKDPQGDALVSTEKVKTEQEKEQEKVRKQQAEEKKKLAEEEDKDYETLSEIQKAIWRIKKQGELEEKPLEVAESETIDYQIVGAIDGVKIKINGAYITIYQFDISDVESESYKKVLSVKKTRHMEVSGNKMRAAVRNGIIAIGFEDHPDKISIFGAISSTKGRLMHQ